MPDITDISLYSNYLNRFLSLAAGNSFSFSPSRTTAAGLASALAVVFAVFLFWIFNTGRHEPVLYFRRIKTSMMYLLWGGILSIYLIFLVYADSLYFSGKATEWWQILGRCMVIVLAMLNISQWFWASWVSLVGGTPSLAQLAAMNPWKYLFLTSAVGRWSGIYTLLMFATAWFIPYLLLQEIQQSKWGLIGIVALPIIVAVVFLYNSRGQAAIPQIVALIANSLPILTNLYWRIRQQDVPPDSSTSGITKRVIQKRAILYSTLGFSVGLSSAAIFIIAQYPISSKQTPLLAMMGVSPYLMLFFSTIAVRAVRVSS